MEWWQMLVLALVILGALNWLLVGLFKFDLVAAVTGRTRPAMRFIYVVIGLAALAAITIFWVA